VGVDRREPDDLFLAQAPIDVPAESTGEIEHGVLPMRRGYPGMSSGAPRHWHHGQGFAKLLWVASGLGLSSAAGMQIQSTI
jgi:hypothetical protein